MTKADHRLFEQKANSFFDDLPIDSFESVDCILCNNSDTITHLFNKGSMSVVRCKCGLIFNQRQANNKALGNFYELSDAMKTWSLLKESTSEMVRQSQKFSKAAKYIAVNHFKSVCDVGCGNGSFLNNVSFHTKGRDIKLFGFDTHPESIEEARKKGVASKVSTIDDFLDNDKNTFDCLTLWGVVEHVKDPVKLLSRLKDRLNDNGKIIICVPNADSLVVRTLWRDTYTFCPQHLWYFGVNTVDALFRKSGLEIEDLWTIEPEVIPSIKQNLGYQPYKELENDWDKERISTEMVLSLSRDILNKHQGYKIVSIARKSQ